MHLIPSASGILAHTNFTSRETRCEVSGIKSIWLVFLRKSFVSWTSTHDGIKVAMIKNKYVHDVKYITTCTDSDSDTTRSQKVGIT